MFSMWGDTKVGRLKSRSGQDQVQTLEGGGRKKKK